MKRGTKSKSKAGAAGRGGARAAAAERGGVTPAPRLGERLAIAALVLPPFIVVPVALDAFRLPQRMLAEWLALCSLVALAWSGSLRVVALRRSPALFAALPLLLLAAASFFTTAHRAHVAAALPDLAIGVAALVGWSLAIDRERLRRVLDAALVPAAALAAIAVLQLHDLWQPVLFGERLSDERLGITSLAGNPGDLAALLVLPCLVAQAGLPGARGAARWWRLLTLAICVYALAGTQTLTSLVAAAAGSLVLWAALLPRRRLLLGVAAVAAAALLLVTLVRPLRERVVRLRPALSSVEALNGALSGRLDGWWAAMRLLQDHPLAGVGLGAYRAEFAPAKLALLAEGVPFYASHINPSFANAHDEYLEVGAELGWPGLLALGWGVALALRAAWRTRSRPAAERALAWGGIVALALLALAYFPLRLGPVAFAWIAWLAWLLGGDESGRQADAEDEGGGRAMSHGARLMLAAALALLLAGQSVRGWHRLQSSVLVFVVRKQMATLGQAESPRFVLRIAEAALRQAQRRDPAAVEPLAFHADLLFVAGRAADAEAAYRRAAAHEPRAETLFNWGTMLWRQGRAVEAAVQLRRGVALAPRLASGLPVGSESMVLGAPIAPIPPLVPAPAPSPPPPPR